MGKATIEDLTTAKYILWHICLLLNKIFCVALDRKSQPKNNKKKWEWPYINNKNNIYVYTFFYFDHTFIENPRIFRRRNEIKPLWWVYVFHNLQRQFSGSQVFIFILKSTSNMIGLDSFATRLHNLGAR